jgi:HlyD family secretion protein
MNKTTVIAAAFIVALTSCGKKTEETTPIRKDVTELVFASGLLEADNTYDLKAEVDGYLTKMTFHEGDDIVSGTVMATVDNSENLFNDESSRALYTIAEANTKMNAPALMQAESALQLSDQKNEIDSIQFTRYKLLYEKNAVSKTEYENYLLQFATSKANNRSARENYRLLKQQADQQLINSNTAKNINSSQSSRNSIKAVIGGRVYKKLKEPGDFVRKGDVIATIGDPKFIYAKVNIDEGNIEKVKIGQDAVVKLNVSKTKTYNGRISEISPSFDESTQSFICKIALSDPIEFTIIKTQLQANIIVSQNKNALLIPRKYIDFGGYVHIKGKKEKVKLETKFVSNEWVQVLSGISDNTILTTDNIAENKTVTSEAGAQISRN